MIFHFVCVFSSIWGISHGLQYQRANERIPSLVDNYEIGNKELSRIKREDDSSTAETTPVAEDHAPDDTVTTSESDSTVTYATSTHPEESPTKTDNKEENSEIKDGRGNTRSKGGEGDEDKAEDSTLGPEETFEVIQDFFAKSSDYVISTVLRSLKIGISISRLAARLKNSNYEDEESKKAALARMIKKMDEKLSVEDLKNTIKKKISALAKKIN